MRAGLTLLAALALGACVDGPRPDLPAQVELPPISLGATAVWLEEREGALPRGASASAIATEDLCQIVQDCVPGTGHPAW